MHTTITPRQIKTSKSIFRQRKISIAPSYVDDNSLQDVCNNINTYFQSPDKTILKRGRSSTVIKIAAGNTSNIVVRRDNFVSLFKFLKRGARKSRSRKIWEKGRFLGGLGLKTVTPIALIEDYAFFVRTASYVLFEYIDGITLKAYFLDPKTSGVAKNAMAEKVVQSIYKWHSSGVTHGDPKASNIMIKNNDIYLIDVEDIRAPKSERTKKHAVTRDKYIILHNWQKYPEQRDVWIRKLVLDHHYGKRYLGKCLVRKFWKDEYAIFSLSFSHSNDANNPLERSIASNSLLRWLNLSPFKNGTISLPENKSCYCIVSRRAFLLVRSIQSYFKTNRVPNKGIFSIALALRICGFVLPDILDGGIFRGAEYVVFNKEAGRSVQSVWKEIKENSSRKKSFILKLADEIGRLHALGFVGVIQSPDSIFVTSKNDSFIIGYKLSSTVRYHPGRRCSIIDKEIKVIKTKLLSQMPTSDFHLFWNRYTQIVS